MTSAQPLKILSQALATLTEEYRLRLCDLSLCIKNLNEHIARKANAEEDVEGQYRMSSL